jgi:hypothetical protein
MRCWSMSLIETLPDRAFAPMSEARLPAKLEVSALLRSTESAGGFGMILKKGEADAGTILIVLLNNQNFGCVFERMPELDGSRKWTPVKHRDASNPHDFESYLQRRAAQDADLWIVELTIADGERLILNLS